MSIFDSMQNIVDSIKSTIEDNEKIKDIKEKALKAKKKTEEKLSDVIYGICDKIDNSKFISNTIDTVGNGINNALSSVNDALATINESIEPKLIINFPKLELMPRVYNHQPKDGKKVTIQEYENKYVIKELNNKIKTLLDKEKAELYYYLGKHLYDAKESLGIVKYDERKLMVNMLEKAFKLFPSNIEIAYMLLDVLEYDELNKERILEVAEICLKLSDYKDIKKKFCKIYFLIGECCYKETKEYSKAIESYKKSLDYDEKSNNNYLYTHRQIAYCYEKLGDYKKVLEICDYILCIDSQYFDVDKLKDRMQEYIKKGITKEQIDYQNYLKDIKFTFKNSYGRRPLSVLEEAYQHYLKAKDLMSQRRRMESNKELEMVKKILPEQSDYINTEMSWNIMIGRDQGETDLFISELLKLLEDRLEVAKFEGNKKEIANIYNELGLAYCDSEMYEKAIECYNIAIDNAYEPSMFKMNLANCYEKMKRFHDALAIYKELKRLNLRSEEKSRIIYKISYLNDVLAGKIGENGENYQLANEHCEKGNLLFNKGLYKTAINEFITAQRIDKSKLDYIFREILCKNIYNTSYSDEVDRSFETIVLCIEAEEFSFLPFLLTVYGDEVYNNIFIYTHSASLYELAIFLLDMVPIEKRFSAPYYKLGRYKESIKKYDEALKLYEIAKQVEPNYEIDDDIRRVKIQIQDGGVYNEEQYNEHLNAINNYKNANLNQKVIDECKEALKYFPDSIEVLLDLTYAARSEKDYYSLKWGATECIRVMKNSKISKDDYLNLFSILKECCEYENKTEEANYYMELVYDLRDCNF